MNKEIILLVAGFHIKITFFPTDWLFSRNLTISQIKTAYKGFIVKDEKQKIDLYINIRGFNNENDGLGERRPAENIG